ncbi:MAG: NifB/NifX family molybdenum-iron cluster-binding protein [Candidatus Omnitrophica bacterium]|nr:NifB/NifX family molybdenum-iron cluster-binding protein [Candidatus Omnitrophota bacterium]
MKIAIPVADGRLCAHFGHCEEFAVMDVDDSKTIIGQTRHTPPMHEPGVLPRWLHEMGVNVIIAGGMGQRAQAIFAQNDIEVVVGAPTGDPEEIVQNYLQGMIQCGDNLCDH